MSAGLDAESRDAIAAVRWRAAGGVGTGRRQGDDPGVLPQRLSTSIQTPDVTAIRAKTRARARCAASAAASSLNGRSDINRWTRIPVAFTNC